MFELASTPDEMLIICQIAFKNCYGEKAIQNLMIKCFESGNFQPISKLLDLFSSINYSVESGLLDRATAYGNCIENLIFIYECADNYILQDNIYELLKKRLKEKKELSTQLSMKVQAIMANQNSRIDADPTTSIGDLNGLEKRRQELEKKIKELEIQHKTISSKITKETSESKTDKITGKDSQKATPKDPTIVALEKKAEEISDAIKDLKKGMEGLTDSHQKKSPLQEDIDMIKEEIKTMKEELLGIGNHLGSITALLDRPDHKQVAPKEKAPKLPVYGPHRKRGRKPKTSD
jgi:hypothetical protein